MSRNITTDDMYDLRRATALEAAAKYRRYVAKISTQSVGNHHPNTNEQDYADRNYVASFHKGLPHDLNGLVAPEDYEKLLLACNDGSPELFDAIPRGYLGADYYKLVDPQAAHCLDVVGPDNWATSISRTPPIFNSAENAANMVELYGKLLCRDISFANYGSNATVAGICAELSAHPGYKGPKIGGLVTPASLFRGPSVGDLNGPYISQYLYQPIKQGVYNLEQKFNVPPSGTGSNYMKTFTTYREVQNGHTTEVDNLSGPFRHIINGRDLATYVHFDHPTQPYENAAFYLFHNGYAKNAADPYKNSENQDGFLCFGPVWGLAMLARASFAALRAAWYHKWVLHRQVRPEVYGAEIDKTFNDIGYKALLNLHDSIYSSDTINKVNTLQGNRLLSQCYPEGSPRHPSYPAGHATNAGACVTILKAFFDEDAPIVNPVQPSADGSTLASYSGAPLTVGGELDKLASNIALGRNHAGVHYRYDGEDGILLGEAVAIRVLKELKGTYNPTNVAITITKRNGEKVTI